MSENEKNKLNEQTTADITQQLFAGTGSSGAVIERDGMRRCLGCMEEYPSEFDICPECGYSVSEEIENALHMFPGTILHDKYIIGRVIGYGGFGVTYLAWDTVLRIKVAIKEYLPSEFSTRAMGQTQITVFSGDKSKQFNDGMQKFIDEAKRLAKFRNENGIVKVFDSFNENGTAYIVMEYLQGETLAQRLEREKTIPVEESIQMLMPIIESLNRVHDEGIIHRDIAPDNIFITNDGKVKLIDFGAARYATTSRSRSLTVIIKPGYSAEEQYRSRGDQGPHTDVYSVGACLYRMITGVTPPDAMERRAQFEKNHHDMLKPIKKFCKDIDPRRENAIYNAMNVRIEDRTSDMISLAGELTSEEPVKRRRSGIKKIDLLHWPLWAKIGVPAGLATAVTLCVLLLFGVIGPKTDFGQYVPDGMTVVPDIVNISEDKAEKKLEKYNLTPVKGERMESDYYKKGMILSQEPDAMNVVLLKSSVEMMLSDGFGDAPIPDVVGHQKELAQTEIEKENFKVEFVEVELGSKEYLKITETEYADGVVCGQDPAAGTLMERVNTTVTLYVSVVKLGTEDKKVPDLSGKSFDEAKELLKKAGLLVGEVTYEFNGALPENQVLGQYPLAGEILKENSGVNLTVNKGEEKVSVPDFNRRSVEVAQQMAEDCGLRVKLVAEETTEYTEGLVFKQSPAKEKQVVKGTIVTLTYAKKKTVAVPNVKGMTEKKATETLQEAGFVVDVSYEKNDKEAKGTVLAQEPASGKADYKSTVRITVNGDADEADEKSGSLISIEIKTQPKKTEYLVGETFAKDGMKVIASYGNGASKDVTSKCTLSQVSAFTTSGQQQITVSYTEDNLTKTATLRVTVLGPTVTMSEKSITVSVGSTKTISVEVKNTKEKVEWSSSNTSVATVDSSGQVKGVSEGTAVITASVKVNNNTVKDSCSVQVTANDIPVSSITLSKTSLTLTEGEKYSLKATKDPSNASADVKWKSNDDSVVSVDQNGNLTANGTGSTTITASAGSKSATCSVTVKEAEVKAIRVYNYSKKALFPGDSFDETSVEIYVDYTNETTRGPIKNTNKQFKVEDQDKNKGYGTHTFKVTYEGKSDTFDVIYSKVQIKCSPTSAEVSVGSTVVLNAVDILPQGETAITWKSDNTNLATVSYDSKNPTTCTVYGKSKTADGQTVTITCISTKYNISATCAVTVKENPNVLTDIGISKYPKTTYYIGETVNLSGLQLELQYSGGKTGKADYPAGGKITCSPTEITKSTTSITVYYEKCVTSFPVVVKTPNITLSETYSSDHTSCKVTATTDPSDVTAQAVTWTVISGNAKPSTTQGKSSTFTGSGKSVIQAQLTYAGNLYPSDKKEIDLIDPNVVKDIEVSYSGELLIGDREDDIKRHLKVTKIMSNGDRPEAQWSDYDVTPDQLDSKTTSITVTCAGISKGISISVKAPLLTFSPSSLVLTLRENYNWDGTLDSITEQGSEWITATCNYDNADNVRYEWICNGDFGYGGHLDGDNQARLSVVKAPDTIHPTASGEKDYYLNNSCYCSVKRNGEEVIAKSINVTIHRVYTVVAKPKTLSGIYFDSGCTTTFANLSSSEEMQSYQVKERISVYAKYDDGSVEPVNTNDYIVTMGTAQYQEADENGNKPFVRQEFHVEYQGISIHGELSP